MCYDIFVEPEERIDLFGTLFDISMVVVRGLFGVG